MSVWKPPPRTQCKSGYADTRTQLLHFSKIARGLADEGKREQDSALNIEEEMMREGRGFAPPSLYL